MRKTLKDAAEVAHYWMHEVQKEGRAGNVSFHGPSIYSYGMQLAKIVRNQRNERCVLLEDFSGVSSSTSTHGGIVKSAVYGLTFHVSPDTSLKDLQDYRKQIERMAEAITDKQLPKTKMARFGQILAVVEEANEFARFFDIADRVDTPESLELLVADVRQAKALAVAEAEDRKRKADAREKRRKGTYRRVHAVDVDHWRKTGEVGSLDLYMFPDMLRHDATDNEIETSRGARFPVAHAKKAFSLVRALHDAKREWKSNGHTLKVGHYQIESVDAKGNVKAVCHQIAWTEIVRLAAGMGWLEAAG